MTPPEGAPDTGRPKDSKKVRIRTCAEFIKVPSEDDAVGDVIFKCSLKHGHAGNHTCNGYVFRKNGTAQNFIIAFHEVGRAEARMHT